MFCTFCLLITTNGCYILQSVLRFHPFYKYKKKAGHIMEQKFTFKGQPAIDIALLLKRNENNTKLLFQLLAFAKQLEKSSRE